ncbi:CAP domain-containing protein, partial [Cellulosimicrobium cellulans]|uniref:CAP domain-containing protein n=1 Tax=Cellulosimicrobium cellulans TaxID=1710 RepID=UPI0011434431
GPGDAHVDPAPSGEAADPAPNVTPAPAPASAAAVPPGPGAISAEGAAVVERTNAERAAAGCGPLVVDERLTAAAQLHSEDMLAQGYFDHTSLDGRSPWDRAKAQGYANPGAENIAKGQATAEDVVRAWMDSPGHRANILDCDLREIGVGHADRVWTQLFGWG